MILEQLRTHDGICVELRVGREVWLATLEVGKQALLTDFRPTNEDPFRTAPSAPMVVDQRLLSALQEDGRDRLLVEAPWLISEPDEACPL